MKKNKVDYMYATPLGELNAFMAFIAKIKKKEREYKKEEVSIKKGPLG